MLGDRDAAGISEPSSHPETSPPDPELMDTTRPKASAPGRSNEVPVGLIEDDLLSADLWNEVIGSLRHTYRNFKVMSYLCRYGSHSFACMFICSLLGLCRE